MCIRTEEAMDVVESHKARRLKRAKNLKTRQVKEIVVAIPRTHTTSSLFIHHAQSVTVTTII